MIQTLTSWLVPSSRGTLDVSRAEVVSRGRERTCFVHPEDPAKCIKVTMGGNLREHLRECRYFRRLHRRDTPSIHIPLFYGVIRTSAGPGNVFSLIRDYDGAVSRDLRAAARCMDHARLRSAAEELKAHFIRWRIITCDMNPGNILAQRISPDSIRLVMVDGIGNREFIPVSTFIPFMCD